MNAQILKNQHIFIFSCLLFLTIGTLLGQRNKIPIHVQQVNAKRLVSPANSEAQIKLEKLDGTFITKGRPAEFLARWADKSLACELYYARQPGFGVPENYPNKIASAGTGELNIANGFENLQIGIYYCILKSTSEPTQCSIEFLIFIQPSTPVRMLEPLAPLNIDAGPPVFRWEAINGVPYYYIVLSQGPLTIKKDPDSGEIESLEGLNVIWQAFTSATSLRYGESDFSNVWNDQNTPRLISGEEYHWMVFSAFSPELQYVAWEMYPLSTSEFSVTQRELSSKPQLISPRENQAITDDVIQFSWQSVQGATRYSVYLQEVLKNDNIGEGTVLVWQRVTIGTTATFRARNFLAYKNYKVRVIAESPNAISWSDEVRFNYNGNSGYLEIVTRDQETNGILPFATIDVVRVDGTELPFSFFTDKSAEFKLDLVAGAYDIVARLNGYVTTTHRVQVPADTQRTEILLPQAEYRVAGQVVRQQTGRAVPFAQISSTFGDEITADGAGYFVLSTDVQINQITIHAFGFESNAGIPIEYNSDGNANAGKIELNSGAALLSGNLSNTAGLPVFDGAFIIQNDTHSYRKKWNQKGRFSFPTASGSWNVRLNAPGYITIPDEYNVNVAGGQERQLNFTLANASIIEGHVLRGGELVGRGTVTLTNQSNGKQTLIELDDYGLFRFDVQSGTYNVMVETAQQSGQQEVAVGENEVKRIEISLSQATVISGTVRDAASNAAISGATIRDAETSESYATTDNNGEYTFAATAGETYNLIASGNGYASSTTQNVTPADGQQSTLDFSLQQIEQTLTTISGRVLANQRPVSDAQIHIVELNAFVFTDSEGLFDVSVEPGVYQVTASFGCYTPQTQLVNATSGSEPQLEFFLIGSFSEISGFVYDENGNPLADANILAAGSESFTARTNADGGFNLCLVPDNYFFLISRIGYLQKDTSFVVTALDSARQINFSLESNFASINGLLIDEDSKPVPNVQLIFSNIWQQKVILSTDTGRFSFNDLYPGKGTLLVRSERYYAPPYEVDLDGQQIHEITINLTENDGTLSGVIAHARTGLGIAGATVKAQVIGSGNVFSTITEFNGEFQLSQLPSLESVLFRVTAEHPNFLLQKAADSVQVFSSGVQLRMLAKNAIVSGQVVDGEQVPVPNTVVQLLQNGQTRFETTTDANGNFTFDGLVEMSTYSILIEDAFFDTEFMNITTPNENVKIELTRHYAFAHGQSNYSGTGNPFSNASIIFTNIDGNGRSDTVSTDESGIFSLQLWPGDYQISAEAPLYYATPNNMLVSFSVDDSVQVPVLSFEKQTLTSMSIDGPVRIANYLEGRQYNLVASDSIGRKISSVPTVEWHVDVGRDTAYFSTNGYLVIVPDFVGELAITVRDTMTDIQAHREIEVFAEIDSMNQLSYFGRDGQRLTMQMGSVTSSVELFFQTQALSPVQKVEQDFRVLEPIFKITPDNVEFTNPPILNLTLPEQEQLYGQLAILRWDNLLSTWVVPEDVQLVAASDNVKSLNKQIDKAGAYAIVEFSEPLGLLNLDIKPNPFSPLVLNRFGEYGMSIQFQVTSNQAALPLITAKVYNLRGDLIQILANQLPMQKGPQQFSWDGKTLDGRIARNGRYLLHFIVEDGKEKQETLKSLVLIQ